MAALHRGGFHIRYEDFYSDFDGTVSSLAGFAGPNLTGFTPPRPNPGRGFWSDNHMARFDEPVFLALEERFRPWIARYYPEKVAQLAKALESV